MRYGKLLFSLLVALILMLPITTNVFAAETTQTPMTPKEYTNYLIDLSSTDPGALEVANNFNKLTSEEQVAYIEFLYSDEYLDLLGKAISGVEVEKKVKVNNVTIPVSTKVKAEVSKAEKKDKVSAGDISIQATYRSEYTATISLSMFGWDGTKLFTTLAWQHNGTSALQVYSVSQLHSNYNPVVWVTDKGTQSGGVSSGKAYGISNFELRATGTAGFISHSVRHEVRGATATNKQHRMITNHPMGGFSWRNF